MSEPEPPVRRPQLTRSQLSDILNGLTVAAQSVEAVAPRRRSPRRSELAAAVRWRALAEALLAYIDQPAGASPTQPTDIDNVQVEYAVQYQDADDPDWYDTRYSPMDTVDAARSHSAWYDRQIGLPSRVIQRRTTVIDP